MATVAQVIDVDGEMSEETVYEVQVEPKDPSPSDPFVPFKLVCPHIRNLSHGCMHASMHASGVSRNPRTSTTLEAVHQLSRPEATLLDHGGYFTA